MLELDHVFTFVDPDFVGSTDYARLIELGFKLEFGRVHHGQGTANRLALFPDSSLEFLWLADRADAERNPLRLDRRADARSRGGSPFGICLRGRLDPTVRERRFWSYPLPGSPMGSIAIARVSEDLRWPMLFVLDTEIDTRPRSLGVPAELFEHPGGFSGIETVRLTSIGDFREALGPLAALMPESLELVSGRSHRLELVLGVTNL